MSDEPCNLCGRDDGTHEWVDDDCVLPHRQHSRRLVENAHVCQPCVERWDDWLNETVELYGTLAPGDVLPDDTAEHQRPKKAPASPAPFRLDAWALLHPEQVNASTWDQYDGFKSGYLGGNIPDVPAVLSGWAQNVMDHLGWTAAAPETVSGATAFLRANTTTLAALEDADTFDTELRWVRRALRNAHGLTNPKPLFACITVDCGGQVWKQDDNTEPRCDRCRRRYGTLDYVRAKRMQEVEQAS